MLGDVTLLPAQAIVKVGNEAQRSCQTFPHVSVRRQRPGPPSHGEFLIKLSVSLSLSDLQSLVECQ
jgi:hypothetical protein